MIAFGRFARWPWLVLIAVVLLAGAISWAALRQKFTEDLVLARREAEQQLQLISSILSAELQEGRYQNIERLLGQMAESNTSIANLQLAASNGFMIASFQRAGEVEHGLALAVPISYSYRSEAVLHLRMDLANVYRRHERLVTELAAIFSTFAALLFVLMHVAVRLQREAVVLRQRTQELDTARNAIAASEAQMRLVADNIPAAFAYIDRDLVIRLANRRYAELFFEPGSDAVGRQVRETVGEKAWPEIEPRIARVLAGETLEYQRSQECADGTQRTLDVHLQPDRSAGGQIPGYYGFVLDITERKRAEDALRESEARFRDLSELSSDWYWEQDENLRFVDMQDAPTGSSPVRAGDYVGKTRWEAHAESLAPERWAAHRRQVEAHEPFRDLEYARRSQDGRLRWVSVSGLPKIDREGRFKGYRGVGKDITEKKLAEQALRLRNRAIEASVNSIMITEPTADGQRIVYVNPAFERITGYPVAEVLGKSPGFLHGKDLDQPGIAALRAVALEQRETTALLRNYRKDGTLFWNELRVAPVRDETGRVTHFIGVASDVTERITYQAEIERQANFDSLTGLANRNLLSDRLRRAIVRAQRSSRVGAALLLDLDRFKVINDSLGHAMGDRVLAQVAQRLSEGVRGDDTVARTGGDEFVVVLADLAREEDVAIVAQKLLGVIASPMSIEGRDFLLSTSVGVAMFPRDGSDPETLLKHADAALYRAKDRGRGCVAFFAQEMNDRAVTYFNLERDLRLALERGEFVLHYQPIIALASGGIVGAEALLRWRRESGQMVAPADFIPIAEESGLIVPIGAWVLRQAAARAREWNSGNRRRLSVAVNLSARQFRDPKLLDTVREILSETGLEPRLLNLELTESTVMHNAEEAIATLLALREIGASLSVDDFGTGYSSLSYLKRLPLDRLKVDRSFLQDIPGDRDNAAITRSVIELAHNLGLEVVAEGVETDAQRKFLLAEGCDKAQGYLFGKPVELETFAALIAAPGNAVAPGKTQRRRS